MVKYFLTILYSSGEKTQKNRISYWQMDAIHLGHKQFLVKLAREYDTLVVGIGWFLQTTRNYDRNEITKVIDILKRRHK